MKTAKPRDEEEGCLHERLLRGEPLARPDVWQAFLGPLVAILRRYHRCDRDQAMDAAMDALEQYLGKPEKYQPDRGRLFPWLANIAKRRATDRWRKGQKDAAVHLDQHHQEDTQERAHAAAVELDAPNPKDVMERDAEVKAVMKRLESVITRPGERLALELYFKGERDTAVYAQALGHGGLSKEEQADKVRKDMDRLKHALKRHGKEARDEDR